MATSVPSISFSDGNEYVTIVTADVLLWNGNKLIAEIPIKNIRRPGKIEHVNETKNVIVGTKAQIIVYGLPLCDGPVVAWECAGEWRVAPGKMFILDWKDQPVFEINAKRG